MVTPLEQCFPGLIDEAYSITSDKSGRYNCIAWALGENERWWWPDAVEEYHWPESVAREESVAAFLQAFATMGYSPCEDGELETGVHKIALYARDGKPTHAARQLPDGLWTSKLGSLQDISHTLNALIGDRYGEVIKFFGRRIAN